MKRFILGVALLAVLFGGALAVGRVMEIRHQPVIRELNRAAELALSGASEAARDRLWRPGMPGRRAGNLPRLFLTMYPWEKWMICLPHCRLICRKRRNLRLPVCSWSDGRRR